MKLLFDQNLSFKLCTLLSDIFPDSAQVRLIGLDRATDREIWDYAVAHSFTIVTLDADFAELSALFGSPPRVVWMRCGNQPTIVVEKLLRVCAEQIRAFELDESASLLEIL